LKESTCLGEEGLHVLLNENWSAAQIESLVYLFDAMRCGIRHLVRRTVPWFSGNSHHRLFQIERYPCEITCIIFTNTLLVLWQHDNITITIKMNQIQPEMPLAARHRERGSRHAGNRRQRRRVYCRGAYIWPA
jgi:hypothetical protein